MSSASGWCSDKEDLCDSDHTMIDGDSYSTATNQGARKQDTIICSCYYDRHHEALMKFLLKIM